MSETDLGGSGASSVVGETRMFDGNVPHDFTDGDARWLRAGFIETDTTKFDPVFWENSVATYWTDGNTAMTAVNDMAVNPAGFGLLLKASGNVGEILRTTDFGKTWTQITVSAGFTAGQYMRAVKWHAASGLFVIVCDGGRILTTPDANTFTSRISNTTQNLMALEIANGMCVAVGNNGVIVTSPDGTAWTVRTSNTSAHLQSVCFGNGVWFAGGSANGNSSCRSTNNGASWTTVTIDGNTTAGITGCVHDGNQFVATASTVGVYKSTDGGVTWSFVTRRVATSAWAPIIYEDGFYFVVGDSTSGVFARSKDLINWTFHSVIPGQSVPGTVMRIRKMAGHYFVIGSGGGIYRGNAYKYAGSPWPVLNNAIYVNEVVPLNKNTIAYVRIS